MYSPYACNVSSAYCEKTSVEKNISY